MASPGRWRRRRPAGPAVSQDRLGGVRQWLCPISRSYSRISWSGSIGSTMQPRRSAPKSGLVWRTRWTWLATKAAPASTRCSRGVARHHRHLPARFHAGAISRPPSGAGRNTNHRARRSGRCEASVIGLILWVGYQLGQASVHGWATVAIALIAFPVILWKPLATPAVVAAGAFAGLLAARFQ